MAKTVAEVRPGAYYDSIVLMQLQRALLELPGVLDAGVVMATPANRNLLADRELDTAPEAGADDLLIVVKAETESAGKEALANVDELLARRGSSVGQAFRHRSVRSAVRAAPEARWLLISVPGRYAAGVAREALEFGLHVFLYSDNVSLEDEIELKRDAGAKGLLLMGPDCGTAIVNGVGLGFANRVRRGSIGLVGASGTGLQAITSEIHNLGGGVSHALGTGGRDLKQEVDARTTRQALDALHRDEGTKVIVVVSKPPHPDVAASLLAQAQSLSKPVVVNFIGYPPPGSRLGNVYFAASLEEAAHRAVELAQGDWSERPAVHEATSDGRRYLRGLFSGGTLAVEALQGLQTTLAPLFSNVPIHPGQALDEPTRSKAHTVLDLGEDVFTVGRLHPMMDNELRIHRIRQEASDPEVRLILLDLVLGEGSHPDPAAELAPAISEVTSGGQVEVAVVVVGTEDDPQDLVAQIESLESAGASVFRTTSGAVEHVTQRLAGRPQTIETPVDLASLEAPVSAINVGLETFFESLTRQGAAAVHVDWRPPAGGDEELMALLEKMKGQA